MGVMDYEAGGSGDAESTAGRGDSVRHAAEILVVGTDGVAGARYGAGIPVATYIHDIPVILRKVTNRALAARRVMVLVGALVAALTVAGCGSSAAHDRAASPSAPATTAGSVDAGSVSAGSVVAGAHGRVGSLQVSRAYIPAPASPDVTAAYFRVVNSSKTPDALTAVTTPVSHDAMLHHYVIASGGSEQMVPLAALPIPAHATAALAPGQTHPIIVSPSPEPTLGATVALTLHFRHAGELTLQVPVVPATGLPQ